MDDDDDIHAAHLERHGFLFGRNIAHSLSPYLHQLIYDHLGLNWRQLRLDSSDMQRFLRLVQHPSCYGASITMPNKVAILPYLDEMTPECRAVGACNTLFLREDHGKRLLCGANTDVVGIRDAFLRNLPDQARALHNRPALVIGGGGAARSAIYALRRWLRVTEIYLVCRHRSEVLSMKEDCQSRAYGHNLLHVATVEQALELECPGAVVACVPDVEDQTEGERLARQIVEVLLRDGGGAMLDMCYTPFPVTRLGGWAAERGWKVILGTEAMIWQGLEQDRYWTGREVGEMPLGDVQARIGEEVARRARL